jgi:peptide subunit release factor 1 (eRF1)
MPTKRELVIEQLNFMNKIVQEANVNIVTCGNCGSVNLHEIKPMEQKQFITCYDCTSEMELCDCPDFFYSGMENSLLYEEK